MSEDGEKKSKSLNSGDTDQSSMCVEITRANFLLSHALCVRSFFQAEEETIIHFISGEKRDSAAAASLLLAFE